MASSLKNLSDFTLKNISDVSEKRFAVIVSEWNTEITEALYDGVITTLKAYQVSDNNIFRKDVPGTFELSLGAQWAAQVEEIDAVICLGCVIQGETRHFDFICDATANGITNVGLKYNKPVIFGVLTTDTQEQAIARSGGKHGNKGDEAAITAIKMLSI